MGGLGDSVGSGFGNLGSTIGNLFGSYETTVGGMVNDAANAVLSTAPPVAIGLVLLILFAVFFLRRALG